MGRFWTKERRDVWKDVSTILTPFVVTALTIVGGWWIQRAVSERTEKQARLGLAIGILQSQPNDSDTDRKLRDWAVQEFGKQTGQPFGADLSKLLRDRPDIFGMTGKALLGSKATGTLQREPGAMPQMPIPETFQDKLIDPAAPLDKK